MPGLFPVYKDIEDKMKEIMGTKVNISSKGNGKGKIEIEYYSDKELERMPLHGLSLSYRL